MGAESRHCGHDDPAGGEVTGKSLVEIGWSIFKSLQQWPPKLRIVYIKPQIEITGQGYEPAAEKGPALQGFPSFTHIGRSK